MPAQMRIDQAGLPPGTPGFGRTDGLATGAQVTVESTGGGTTHLVNLLWVPPSDTTAVASLTQSGPTTWTFNPTPGVYGTYRIELVVDQGLPTESRQVRCFTIRTPNAGLIIPAANEAADPSSTLLDAGPDRIQASEQNEPFGPFTSGSPWGWWRALDGAMQTLDQVSGAVGIGTKRLVFDFAWQNALAASGTSLDVGYFWVPAGATLSVESRVLMGDPAGAGNSYVEFTALATGDNLGDASGIGAVQDIVCAPDTPAAVDTWVRVRISAVANDVRLWGAHLVVLV